MGRLALAVSAAVMMLAGEARTACAPNFPRAVACFSPDAAASAYRIVGRDARVLDRDNVRAMLERAGCVSFSRVADPGRPILQAGQGRISHVDRWVDVLYVSVESAAAGGGSAVYIAADWLSGACERFRSLPQ